MNNEIMQLCRLCLVKDQAHIPIFTEQDDRQIFVKITACLPIRVSKDDSLPKKICDSCQEKLDSLYQFWNTTVFAEKQLLTWLGQALMETDIAEIPSIKQEELDPLENVSENSHENFVLHESVEFISKSQVEFHSVKDEEFENNYFDSTPAKRRRQEIIPKLKNEDTDNEEKVYKPPVATIIVKSEENNAEDLDEDSRISLVSDEVQEREQSKLFGMQRDDNEENLTLRDVTEEEEVTALNLLPVKSRKRYEKEYDLFMKWRQEKKIEIFSEAVVLDYISELSKVQKSSTLWARYSMLKATLMIKNDVDISQYTKLMAFIKRQSIGYKAKKSKTFTKEHIQNFLSGAPDEEYLLMKVIAIIGLSGACRSEELKNMTVDNIRDMKSLLVISIPDSRTKKPRVFTIVPTKNVNLVEIYRKYMSIRPINVEHRRLFLNYQKGKCTVQPVGINKISKIPTLVAKYLKIDDASSYTGHCWRRTSASVLID